MAFVDHVRLLRRWFWFVVVCAVVAALGVTAALLFPRAQYQVAFSYAIGPGNQPASAYSTLLEALDKRSVPSTLAEIVSSELVQAQAAQSSHTTRGTMTVAAVVVTNSNVVNVTITGHDLVADRAYASALQAASRATFEKLYSLYDLESLRDPTTATAVSRHLATGLVLAVFGGALIGYLLALTAYTIRTNNTDDNTNTDNTNTDNTNTDNTNTDNTTSRNDAELGAPCC
jgi:hypothetical protein